MNNRTITIFATIPADQLDAGAALLKLAAAQLGRVDVDGKSMGLRGCEVMMVIDEPPAWTPFTDEERAELDRLLTETEAVGIFGL